MDISTSSVILSSVFFPAYLVRGWILRCPAKVYIIILETAAPTGIPNVFVRLRVAFLVSNLCLVPTVHFG
jgi:hypothetical protein